MTALHWVLELREDEAAVLRAARGDRHGAWRCVDLAREAGLKYGVAWRALVRLQSRGYASQDLLRRWSFRWERVALPHRASVSIPLLGETWEPPTLWERIVRRWGPYFGLEWVA